MCGIIGVIGEQDAAPLLVGGLKRLEYRGYDSAGIATLVGSEIARCRAEGKLVNLEARLALAPLSGSVGIGHTRWATHGVPVERNAHPHSDGRVAVVHNGIIENYSTLRAELEAAGCVFRSDTDTETIVHLISSYWQPGADPVEATHKALLRLEGAFALAVIFAGQPDLMIAARRGSPLAVGYGQGEMFVGSDALALVHVTNRLSYLEEGDWAILSRSGVEIRNTEGLKVERPVHVSALSSAAVGKGGHRHYMAKEIFEQPQVIGDSLRALVNPLTRTVTLPDLPFDLASVSRITIVACGTSFYAGLVARYWLEQIARIPVDIDVASEFRYRNPVLQPGGLALFISQSGETADTLAALRYCKAHGQKIVSLVNVTESTMARESDAILHTLAGPEIGVASTKAFTTQLTVLACLVLALARARGAVTAEREMQLAHALGEVPARVAEILNHDEHIRRIAEDVMQARDVLYLGRGSSYPIALEGALKLKEISYIHAEGYAAGEMKHGPIALIDDKVPVVVIAPGDELLDKTISNVQETVARGGRVIVFSDARGVARMRDSAVHAVILPEVDPFVAPILYALPVQLLAYHVAVLKGTDVDQPRNLAKSVTVE
ncbi:MULTISPECIES: glutamine--fructose-6-phosphate transaminase (isomerizing) [unclassified Haematospirillum]|uniref:glutamine--fructose-6-phosphate transaminase (isomerizing) n=1 Tax=unclassified Haematospirillum TaxID=2622088 RepID=UPI00143A2581|nr:MULTISPECIES: glutamine--fructose-6-phosphate transaminase (isomerizing) [unclassified Haematospirillum]NKD54013.1 glutamine--fructose-6-phosphate transaminase (isomerizing) [Haematospirillum sp. H4890]NKD74058.1 glutamine--fructose-6-phosphate transaminase (isomerizing) [Haematospirillum sp. H4485]NKD87270.1 glutamine--fructose-6-phosphate transaminase (isomerizing) [Haematospirillum sp. 15-248]